MVAHYAGRVTHQEGDLYWQVGLWEVMVPPV
jgi:hypothetical protein